MAEFHFDAPSPGTSYDLSKPWYSEMTRYHWFVMLVASLAWLFDCLDQQLFVMVRQPAMRALMPGADTATIDVWANYATAIFIVGWATGGLIFGALGDRIGRVKTMLITILLYSLFTGLSAASIGFWDFAFYRFLTGLGVGGEFAVGVSLVAEVMPDRARAYCLTLLQMLSTVGNIGAALINMGMGVLEEQGLVSSPWRLVFLIGTLPALLTVVIMSRLKEPEKWQKASHEGAVAKQLGSYRELFSNPRWRKHALLGLMLAFSGVVGLWGVGFFTPDLTGSVMESKVVSQIFDAQLADAKAKGDSAAVDTVGALQSLIVKDGRLVRGNLEVPTPLQPLNEEVRKNISGRLAFWRGVSGIMLQIGACFGMFAFGWLAQRMGRKPTFAVCFIAAWASTAAVFWYLNEFSELFWMVPIMGVCQLSVFAGYAIYFPELFPTYLRSTGTSFCYNVGRFVAAGALLLKGQIQEAFSNTPEPIRYAGVTMSFVLLIALVALPFLPETKGKPLPE
jgi:MFS family permease